MDHNIRPRAPFTLRNKTTAQECEFQDQAEVDTFLAGIPDAADWQPLKATVHIDVDLAKLRADAAAGATDDAAPEAPAAEPTPAPTEAPAAAPARKPRAAKK